MVDNIIVVDDKQSQPKKNSIKIIRDLFAFFLWLYIITKLFVFDFDIYLIQNYAPRFHWIVDLKFVWIIGLVSIYWITVGDKSLFKTILFLALFPFYFFGWRIGKLVFRNWFTAFTAIGYIGSFLKSLKFNLTTFSIFCIASVLVISANNSVLIIIGISLLGIYLILHFGQRLYYAFIPSKALVFPREGIIKFLEQAKKMFALPPDIKSTEIEHFTPEQKSKWGTNLQFVLLANRAAICVASNLKKFQESRLMILYFIFGLLLTFFATVGVFAISNYGLYRIDQHAFYGQGHSNLFFFIYYSLSTILGKDIVDFYPISPFARLLNVSEVLLGVFILVILFFMYTNIKSDKTKSQMDSLINSLDKKGTELELFINQEFSVDVEQAISEVEKVPGNLIKLIYYFSPKKTIK